MTESNNSEIGGYKQAAAWTGIKENTLYGLVNQKRIPHIRLSSRFVRFVKADIIAWMNAHQVDVRR